jgi:hypothetical protein
MPPINFIAAVVVMFGMLAVLKSYLPLISRDLGPFGFYMMRGAAIGAAVSVMRLGYWDVLQFFSGDYWPVIRGFFGGQMASTIFNLLLLFAIRDLLQARVYLIPESERHLWSWWRVIGHPSEKCIFNWKVKK